MVQLFRLAKISRGTSPLLERRIFLPAPSKRERAWSHGALLQNVRPDPHRYRTLSPCSCRLSPPMSGPPCRRRSMIFRRAIEGDRIWDCRTPSICFMGRLGQIDSLWARKSRRCPLSLPGTVPLAPCASLAQPAEYHCKGAVCCIYPIVQWLKKSEVWQNVRWVRRGSANPGIDFQSREMTDRPASVRRRAHFRR
jgi:hypothetical protein